MKKAIVMLCTLCLMLALAIPASANLVEAVGDSGAVSGVDSLGTTTSINFTFAKLQMELAASAKESAMVYIQRIQELQAQQKEADNHLREARSLQETARRTGNTTQMPAPMAAFMNEKNIPYKKNVIGGMYNADDWDVIIRSLEANFEQVGTDVQTQMVYVQDFMNQYNAYLQGANNAIQGGMQVLTATARGQSLFSTGGAASMAYPPIVISLLAGVVVGMALMWAIQRKRLRGVSK